MARKKRKYTMSERARAQRRGAAHKHGLYAATTMRQVLPPCRAGTCPLGRDHYPCTVRVTMDETDDALERCPLPLVTDEEVVDRFTRAIAEGDPAQLAELQARALAAAVHVRDQGLATLIREGLTANKTILNKEGEVVGELPIQHPAAWPVMELLKHTGATADQQAVTPKSRAERDRDVSLGEALSFMAAKRRALDEADGQ